MLLCESLDSLQFQALQEGRVILILILGFVLELWVFCFLIFFLCFGHLFEQTPQYLERNSLWAGLVLIVLLFQVLKLFWLALMSSWQESSLLFESSAPTFSANWLHGWFWLHWSGIIALWGEERCLYGLKWPAQPAFFLTLI